MVSCAILADACLPGRAEPQAALAAAPQAEPDVAVLVRCRGLKKVISVSVVKLARNLRTSMPKDTEVC